MAVSTKLGTKRSRLKGVLKTFQNKTTGQLSERGFKKKEIKFVTIFFSE